MITSSPYSIVSAQVFSPSLPDGSIEISRNILELNFFQNINRSYIDCRLVLLDDFGFRKTLSMAGTERIVLQIGLTDDDIPLEPIIEKEFFFVNVLDVKRTNDKAEVLSMDLVESHVYVDAVKQFSRSYTDSFDNIISNICSSELGKTVRKTPLLKIAQGIRKILVPFLSPLQVVDWLLLRATTDKGAPIFLYSDLYSNDLYMSSYEELMSMDVINKNMPLRYSRVLSTEDIDDNSVSNFFQIKTVEESNSEDSLELYRAGAIGSSYSNIDVATGFNVSQHVSIRNIVDEMYVTGMISENAVQSLFDPSLIIDDKISDEYNSAYLHQISSSNTYNQYLGYHDETAVLDEQGNILESSLKAKSRIYHAIMRKNRIDVGLDGSFFFKTKTSVGNKLRVIFLNPNVAVESNNSLEIIDKMKSGDYLVTAIRHILIAENHSVSLRLSKLSDLPSDFSL